MSAEKLDHKSGKPFVPKLLYVSGSGNAVYSEDPDVVKQREAEMAAYYAEQERLIESARKKITPEEFDAIQASGSDY